MLVLVWLSCQVCALRPDGVLRYGHGVEGPREDARRVIDDVGDVRYFEDESGWPVSAASSWPRVWVYTLRDEHLAHADVGMPVALVVLCEAHQKAGGPLRMTVAA